MTQEGPVVPGYGFATDTLSRGVKSLFPLVAFYDMQETAVEIF